MELLLIAGGLAAVALLLPTTPGLPLAQRYRRLARAGVAVAAVPRRRLLAWVPVQPVLALLPRRYRQNLHKHLLYARLGDAWSLGEFIALKLLISLLLLGLMALYVTRIPWAGLAIPVQALAGWALPDFLIKRRAAGRRAAMQRELPHVLSNLAICLQTGLSLRSSLVHLSDLYPTGVLGQELRLATTHLTTGASPREALTALLERVGTPELTQSLGNILAQADKSLAAAAQAAAAESRAAWQRRRRQAEAIAHTTSLRLYLPQLLLGMPALFLVLLGPAILQIWTAMRGL